MGIQCFAGEAPFLFLSGKACIDERRFRIVFLNCEQHATIGLIGSKPNEHHVT